MMFKRMTAVIVTAIFLFVLSPIAGAGEWKAVYGRAWANNETGDSGGAIFVRDEQGVEHRLTKDGVHSSGAFWLPDGRILFSGDRPEHENTIHIMDADGSNLTTLPYVGWSPVMSENYLAFETETGNIKVVNLRTKELTTFPLASGPAISPDETMIAFDNGAGTIAVSDIERDTRREAARISTRDRPWFYDNDRIVFTHWNEEDGVQRIAIVDLQTGEITPLAPGGLPSVTGEWIVFAVYDVYAMKLDGSERHTLPGIAAGAHIVGDLSLPPEDPVEEPRVVEPRGKLPTAWGALKKR